MKRHPLMLSALVLPALVSCSNNPNSMLIFGDNAHIGLHVGANAATGGGALNVGYKHRSVALVPVSVLNSDGISDAIRSTNGQSIDAFSVFAVFESSASQKSDAASSGQTRVGQIFSTGAAAQAITEGFKCRAEGTATCGRATPSADTASAASAGNAPGSTTLAKEADTTKTVKRPEGPFQTPLIYARTDVFGLDVGGSLQDAATSQETSLTLGYGSRNLALVPVYRESANHHVDALFSRPTKQSADAFSVLGQFQANSGLTGVAFGLERFFATGLAAANLGDGLKATIAKGRDATPATPAASSAQ